MHSDPKNLSFIQLNSKHLPDESEIVKSVSMHSQQLNDDVQLFIIGSSHQICIGEYYTERLSCKPEKIGNITRQGITSKQIQFDYKYEVNCNGIKFTTTINKEVFSLSDFKKEEGRILNSHQDLYPLQGKSSELLAELGIIHCFDNKSSITSIKIKDQTIRTIHTYPQTLEIVYTKTIFTPQVSSDVNL